LDDQEVMVSVARRLWSVDEFHTIRGGSTANAALSVFS
jgi:hypothetical protein